MWSMQNLIEPIMMGLVLVLTGWRGMSFLSQSPKVVMTESKKLWIPFSTPIGGEPRNNYKISLLKQFYYIIYNNHFEIYDNNWPVFK